MKYRSLSIAVAFAVGLVAGPALAQMGTGGQQQQPGMTGQQEQRQQQQPGAMGQQEQQRQQPGAMGQDRDAIGQQDQQRQQQQAQHGQEVSPDQLSSDQVRELQQSLQAQGVSPGPIDGIMGPMTRQAIEEFQQQEGIAATGQLNEETLEALDLDVQEFMGVAPAFEDQQRQQQDWQQQDRQQQEEGIDQRMQDRQPGQQGTM